MTKRPFVAVAFTDGVFVHNIPDGKGGEETAPFAFDFATLEFAKNPVVVDFNHDDAQPIGYAYLKVEGGALIARGEFASVTPGDCADRIANTANDIPYGISPTVSFLDAERIDVPEGQTFQANGREYPGPVAIMRGAKILGLSVCPYPTDDATRVQTLRAQVGTRLATRGILLYREGSFVGADAAFLAKEKFKMDDDLKNEEQTPTNDTEQFSGDEGGVKESGAEDVKCPELQEYVNKFGLEKGVQAFQSGLSLEEATTRDYEEKSAELARYKAKFGELEDDGAGDEEEKTVEQYAEDESEDKPDEDEAKFRKSVLSQLSVMNRAIARFAAQARTGDRQGVAAASPSAAPIKYSDAIAKRLAALK